MVCERDACNAVYHHRVLAGWTGCRLQDKVVELVNVFWSGRHDSMGKFPRLRGGSVVDLCVCVTKSECVCLRTSVCERGCSTKKWNTRACMFGSSPNSTSPNSTSEHEHIRTSRTSPEARATAARDALA